MGVEIERKFLVVGDEWRHDVIASHLLTQGYFMRADGYCLRVRTIDQAAGKLTIKSERQGIARLEFEYDIPVADAETMLEAFCGVRVLSKIRHLVRQGEHLWEIDEYQGRHSGLLVAEVELKSVDEAFERPVWLGEEVSGDRRYANMALAMGLEEFWKK